MALYNNIIYLPNRELRSLQQSPLHMHIANRLCTCAKNDDVPKETWRQTGQSGTDDVSNYYGLKPLMEEHFMCSTNYCSDSWYSICPLYGCL